MTSTNPELNLGSSPIELWPEAATPGWPEVPMTMLVGGRYQMRHHVARRVLLAQDLWLRQPVLLRQVGVVAQQLPWAWRRRARDLAARRHPNFLNLYGPLRDGRAELVVTDCPRGLSLERLLREGVRFSLEKVVELLPLTALDLAAALTSSWNGPRLSGIFIEPRDGSVHPDEFLRQPPSEWPSFVTRLDVWDLARPRMVWREIWRRGARGEEGSAALSVRHTALLTYGLLAGMPRRRYEGFFRMRPLPQLSGEANALLRGVVRGRRRFASSEQFLAALEKANRAGPGVVAKGETTAVGMPEAVAEPAAPGRTRPAMKPRAMALPRVSTVMAGAAALLLVFAAVIYERSRPGSPWERPAGGVLTLRADPADAKVLLDGAEVGTGELRQRRLSAGMHSLMVARSGFQTRELPFEVKAGQTQNLGTVALLPEGGDLSVGADLAATPFEVVGPKDQKLTGTTPGKLSQLPPGLYTVHLRPPGWPEYTETVEVKAGQDVAATHEFGEAVPIVPVLPTGPTPLLQLDKADEVSEPDEEDDAAAKARSSRVPRQNPPSKAEAFRRFDAEWDAKERSVQTQISSLDKRISAASGPRRDHLRTERADLERRRNYVHDMRRYQRGQLRHKYGEPDNLWDSIRNVFGRR